MSLRSLDGADLAEYDALNVGRSGEMLVGCPITSPQLSVKDSAKSACFGWLHPCDMQLIILDRYAHIRCLYRMLHAFHVPTDYTTKAPCTRQSALLDTRPMRARVWQTTDAFITRYRSWTPESFTMMSLARMAQDPMSTCSMMGHSDGFSAVRLT
jgi:hypothetical protein